MPDFVVVDLTATYRMHAQHAVLMLRDLFDRYYWKNPLQGAVGGGKYQLGK